MSWQHGNKNRVVLSCAWQARLFFRETSGSFTGKKQRFTGKRNVCTIKLNWLWYTKARSVVTFMTFGNGQTTFPLSCVLWHVSTYLCNPAKTLTFHFVPQPLFFHIFTSLLLLKWHLHVWYDEQCHVLPAKCHVFYTCCIILSWFLIFIEINLRL